MSERNRNILRGALALAVGGALTYTALKKTPSLNETVVAVARHVLDYDKRKAKGTTNGILHKIPGSYSVADLLAEALAAPGSRWENVNPHSFRLYLNPNYLIVECRPSAIGDEVLLTRALKPPSQRSRLKWGISRDAETDFWIMGKEYSPQRKN